MYWKFVLDKLGARVKSFQPERNWPTGFRNKGVQMHLIDKDVFSGIASKIVELRGEVPYLNQVEISSRLDFILADLDILDSGTPVLDHTRMED